MNLSLSPIFSRLTFAEIFPSFTSTSALGSISSMRSLSASSMEPIPPPSALNTSVACVSSFTEVECFSSAFLVLLEETVCALLFSGSLTAITPNTAAATTAPAAQRAINFFFFFTGGFAVPLLERSESTSVASTAVSSVPISSVSSPDATYFFDLISTSSSPYISLASLSVY